MKTPIDMPDDTLKDIIGTVKRELDACENFEADGMN